MNPTFFGLELKRILRDPASLFFMAVLPAFLFYIFGVAQSWGDERIGDNGNVTMYIMISMAAYGAVTATVAMGARGAMERIQGWGRQIGLTPMSDHALTGTKALVAVIVAMIPVALIYAMGALLGSDGTARAWLLSALVVVAGSCVFALYGLICALAFRSEAALSAASGSVVLLAFLGNIFFPLSGALLTFAKFTPLYGYVNLARYPLTEGVISSNSDGPSNNGSDPLWALLLNVGVWTLVLGLVATWLVRRGRERQ